MGFLDFLAEIAAGAEIGGTIGEACGEIAKMENGKSVGTLAGAAIATGAHLMGKMEIEIVRGDEIGDDYDDYVIIDGKKIENIEV